MTMTSASATPASMSVWTRTPNSSIDGGNSVRGLQVCETVSRELRLHSLSPPRTAATTVRARYDLAGVRSKRRRSAADGQRLDAQGGGTQVFLAGPDQLDQGVKQMKLSGYRHRDPEASRVDVP